MEVNDNGGVNHNGDTIQPTDRHEQQQAVSVDVVDILPESDTEPAERKPLAEASVSYQKKVPRSKSVTERAMNRWRTVQTHIQERGEAKRAAVSKWQNVAELTRSMSHGVADFLGVAEEAKEERDKRIEKWRARSRRMHSNSVFLGGHKMSVQPDYTDSRSVASGEEMEMGSIGQGFDQVDGPRSSRRVAQPVDPLSRGRRPMSSRMESYTSVASGYRSMKFQSVKKNSVMKMAYDGLRTLTQGSVEKPTTATPLKSRSFSPAVKTAMACNNYIDLTWDDTFFDVAQPTSARVVPSYGASTTPCASRLMNSIGEAAEETLLPGARKPVNVPTVPQTPSTPGIDDVDGATGSSQHIAREVLDLIWQRSERQVGVGLVGRLFNRKYKQSKIEQANSFADDFDTHRPYFTYWVTFVQITCFVFTIAVYNPTNWGFMEQEYSGEVRMPNGAWESHVRLEQSNMWYGPRQEDLIHIGAKFSPCMRYDGKVMSKIDNRRQEEAETACCVRNDLSICMQTNKANCTSLLWSWQKFNSSATEIHKRGGSVCGYDYSLCSEGLPDNISTWPICSIKSRGDDRHLKCETVARPCCVGKQGRCMITSPDHCAFLRGYFHSEANLCSQVDCLSDVCGMLPFLYKDQPNQFYRLWTSLFIHAGIIPLFITAIFQMFIMRDLEKLAGWLRIGLIYIVSGIAGNLTSAIFLPYHPEAGPTGSQFGLLACLVVEVIQSWQCLSNPRRALAQLLVVLLVLFCLGFLPWIDNYAHVTGFIFGFLLSFPLLPHIAYLNRKLRVIIVTSCLLLAAGLFTVLVVFFYVHPLYSCDGCEFFNCLPFTVKFCESMKVRVDPN